MSDQPVDPNSLAPLVAQYGFLELPNTDPENRLFVSSGLAERYSERKHNYVLILHRLRKEHFIIGLYTDLKEALQTRYVINLVLNGGGKFSEAFVAMVHETKGAPVDDKFYDPKTDAVKDFEEEPEKDES
jgi:hypothetical protein